MKIKTKAYNDIIKLAEEYGVNENAIFLAAVKNYEIERQLIERMKETVDNDDAVVVKEYVKGRENASAHPLLKEITKHIDSANKSLQVMVDIITKLGVRKTAKGKYQDFLDE